MLSISTAFDGGAIDVVELRSTGVIDLALRPDSHADFRQWFYFRVSGARGVPLTLRLVNARDATYPEGWTDYQARASSDGVHWVQVTTRYAEGVLEIRHTPLTDSTLFAYFEPYSGERGREWLGRIQSHPDVALERLATTVDGRDLDLVRVAGPGGPVAERPPIWIIARQHPGETMAQWFVEGLVDRLLDDSDAVARQLRQKAEFLVVPNMNPDGSARGNLRTNAAGANLNREWSEPSAARSPEVLAVRQALQNRGVRLFVDVHGDEALPYVFIAGSEMLPGFTERQRAEQARFVAAFKEASPDFQDRIGYPAGRYSSDALKLASKWVGHTFGCLSLTLEMPFKDNANDPDPRVGWNGARSQRLGAAMLAAILCMVRSWEDGAGARESLQSTPTTG